LERLSEVDGQVGSLQLSAAGKCAMGACDTDRHNLRSRLIGQQQNPRLERAQRFTVVASAFGKDQ